MSTAPGPYVRARLSVPSLRALQGRVRLNASAVSRGALINASALLGRPFTIPSGARQSTPRAAIPIDDNLESMGGIDPGRTCRQQGPDAPGCARPVRGWPHIAAKRSPTQSLGIPAHPSTVVGRQESVPWVAPMPARLGLLRHVREDSRSSASGLASTGRAHGAGGRR